MRAQVVNAPGGGPQGNGLVVPACHLPRGLRIVVTTRDLQGAPGSRHAGLNLAGHVGDDPLAVAANRQKLRMMLQLPGEPCWLEQVHGAEVCRVDSLPQEGPPPLADAAVTSSRGRVLAVLTADCLPVVLARVDGSRLAVAHAGWRGLAAGVLEAAAAAVDASAGEVLAWIGPAIGADSYEVGSEVHAALTAAAPWAERFFTPSGNGRWHCDLAAVARARLARAGVRQVHGGDIDTFTDCRFYSHRRDRSTGRFATLAWWQAGA